ncbi:hypothetical protein JTB14_004039 [Gonioctena quinquepunctata]|nr:hypothetical protein JTB14_004039 [Gonioctena quinquepunctata]
MGIISVFFIFFFFFSLIVYNRMSDETESKKESSDPPPSPPITQYELDLSHGYINASLYSEIFLVPYTNWTIDGKIKHTVRMIFVYKLQNSSQFNSIPTDHYIL